VHLLADLSHQLVEALLDVDTGLGRALEERTVEGLGLLLAFGASHLALLLQIALVAHKNHGHIVLILHAENLLTEHVDFLKGAARGNRKHT